MTKREQMLLAIAAQKSAARTPEKELPPLKATPVPPPDPVKTPRPSLATRLGDRQARHGRLPHGSRFEATYDALYRRWHGTLTATVGGEERVFTAESSGVWKLMGELDDLYRVWLKAQQPPTGGQA